MNRIGFIRHGSTAWNKEKRAQGNSDIPLDDLGLLEADKLAVRLSNENWDIIYSSDLLRAKQTAEVIKNEIDKVSLYFEPRLREVGGGQIEGTTEEERKEKWGNNWWELDLGIERTDNVLARGLQVIHGITQKHEGKNVLVISHGSFIKHLLKELLPQVSEESLNNCSITVLQNTKDKWNLELHNCTKHLV